MSVKKININQSEQTYYIASEIYDVSARNNDVTFESLSALLGSDNLSNLIPSEIRCGGMTIRFVQSSDNKYVQYRLIATSFSTTASDWEGVDDEPTVGSDNLVKSGGVADKISELEHNQYHFLYGDDFVNSFIKELYIDSNYFGSSDLYLYQIQKNVSGTWLIVISNDDISKSIAFVAKHEEPFIKNSNGSIVVNWESISDGQYVYNLKHKLNSLLVENDCFSPYHTTSSNKEGIAKIGSDVEILKTNNTRLDRIASHNYTEHPIVSKFLKEIYIDESWNKNWDSLYIFQIRRNVSDKWTIIFTNDKSATENFAISVDTESNIIESFGVHIYVDWSVVEAGKTIYPNAEVNIAMAKSAYLCTLMNINNKILNQRIGTDINDFGKTIGKTPFFTWIDDDGVYNGIEKIKGLFETENIPVTFGVIPPLSDIAYGAVTRLDYFLDLQKKGHHITAHPVHNGWYGVSYDISKVEPQLIECLTELTKAPFLHCDMLIYPGSSDSYPAVVDIVKKWCKCAVTAGFNESGNHLGKSTKWKIKRCFIEFNDTRTVSWYKNIIDESVKHGDWLIFGTHSNGFFTSTDTSDESVNNIGNLTRVIKYAKSKAPFYTLYDAFNRRSLLFDLNDICL